MSQQRSPQGYTPQQGGYPPPQYPYPPQQQPPKKKGLSGGKIALIVVGALVVVGIIAGAAGGGNKSANTNPTATPASAAAVSSATTQAAAPAATTASASLQKIGETKENKGYLLTVNGKQKADSFSTIAKAKEGNILVAVDVTIGSNKDKGVSANGLYCTLKDDKGFKYTMQVFNKEPALAGQNDIPKGDKVRGWVTFEVPKDATGLKFEYSPMFDGLLFTVDLGQ